MRAVWFAISFIFVVSLLCAEQAGKVGECGPMTDNAVPRANRAAGTSSTERISPDAHFFRIRDRRRKSTLPHSPSNMKSKSFTQRAENGIDTATVPGVGNGTFSTSTPDHINIQ